MAAAAKHRDALLAASVRLFRQKGYAGTGLSEILQESGAPKGSLYHYFPGGKVEIGAEAVQLAGKTVTRTLKDLAAKTDGPGALVSHYLDLLAGWMAASDYRDGCPITTTLLETVPEHEAIREAGAAAFAAWAGVLEESAVAAGIPQDRAARLAHFAISALEGALVQCRVSGAAAPLRLVAEELSGLYAAAETR
ncbi:MULTISPECIES: TetR/AcrR family transcriptional regulator [Hyphomonas]|uniref:TetR/AcrR family transcriptional regulator n=1 Tax=Hyphomonas adhaerens TaxID=81029 RepID=A0A3B9H2F1_9PROT|nr:MULTISPECIES: TetR/AcrR family transcriptional regulator [Hyphomonas]MBB41495.1 TetR family transcriptional regulator [Hyphomonas sp.]HAE28875.1 TetR/AcrR family transcriptional regulator [Hyphomonas adhaerens]|tara:strand:- start:1464 stop:2045 length:582 start_codon:yes stop_codon:yes gene_type:complete